MKKLSKYLFESKSADSSQEELSNEFQFWSLLVFGIPSLICSLFIIYKYLSDRIRRHALHNHTILIIILTNIILILTDFSWMLDSLRHPRNILSLTPTFCMIWWFLDYTLYAIQTIILAWASIERHILIFHTKLISTSKKKFVYHYLPLILLLVYINSFYLGVIFLPPCQNKFELNLIECGSNPCYLSLKYLALFDLLLHSVLPTFLTAIFSFALLYRVIRQKKRIRQPIQWRKHRRLSMQLLPLSAVYLFLNFPLTVIMLVQLFQTKEPQFGFGTQLYIFFLTYGVTLSLPFVVYHSYLSHEKAQHQRISPILTVSQHQRMYDRNIPIIQ